MDEPATKRRKTASLEREESTSSPLKRPPRRPSFTSRSIAAAAAAEIQKSPLKEPPRRFSLSPTKGGFDRSPSPLKQPPRRPSRRPSFASPTKASLARGYPDLLHRPSSSGLAATNGHTGKLARGQQALAFVLGDRVTGSQTASTAATQNGHDTIAGAQSPRASWPQHDTTPRTQRTRPRTKDHLASNELEGEAELPTTPSQGALEEQYTPRPGIFSSPTKRPPRLKHPLGQSPLQKKALAVQQDESDVPLDETINEAKARSPQALREKKQPPDPELEEKRREKAQLIRQLQDLEKQVTKCTQEITKIQAQPVTHVSLPQDREYLVAFIDKISKSGEQRNDDESPEISSLLCSFLPFSTLAVAPPKPERKSTVGSHQPLELEDPLPYLEMFTSFKFSTKVQLPRGRVVPSSNRVHQKHLIEIIGPQSLLTSTISITIDTLTITIIDLKLMSLSNWADRELGSFIRAKADNKDLGNACWAIGSYWDIAKKRAEYWHRCEAAFGHLIPGQTNEDTENLTEKSRGKLDLSLSRRDLNRHLGRDILVLEDRHVLLKISWKIVFDWTGEAESEISAAPAVPQVWLEADSNDSFKKIPETFVSLLQNKGAFAATKTMVALLFSE
ncbi:hypothetical protein N0V90_000704 [Kalmusia sp. IMI 367209]|nr:hypothetical protein N0V90_000704 [Kalmusia sp. IMI 367209]